MQIYKQHPLEKIFIFTIYENYTLALKVLGKSVGGENAKVPRYEVKW